MKRFFVVSCCVRNVIGRVNDKVYRHHVHAPALDAERRHPWRQNRTHFLQQFEEVIRPVDLVDFTGV